MDVAYLLTSPFLALFVVTDTLFARNACRIIRNIMNLTRHSDGILSRADVAFIERGRAPTRKDNGHPQLLGDGACSGH